MMHGHVNHRCEAILQVAVGYGTAPKQMVNAIIDTGFTGFLSLPLSVIEQLNLPWQFRDLGTLGDGSEVVFEMYKATVIWDGQAQIIDVAASEAEPLIGMSLLYGFKLEMEAIEGGSVTLATLSSTRTIA